MKRIKLTLVLCLLATFVKGQTYVDLKFRLDNPKGSVNIPPMQTFSLTGTVKNLSATPFQLSDSIAFYLLTGNDSFLFFNSGRFENFVPFTNIFLNQGDSAVISLPFAFSNTFENLTVDLCIFIKPLNRQTKAIFDNQLGNNKGCAVVTVKQGSGVGPGISSFSSLSLYPNPANNFFMVKSPEIIESLSIKNIAGMEVLSATGNREYFDCSTLPQGIYFVTVKTAGTSFTQKLSIGN